MLEKASAVFERIVNIFAFVAGLLLLFMALSVTAEVIMRYFFNRPIIWVVEIAENCLLFITFLGTAWVLKRDKHIKIDLLLIRVKPKIRAFLNLINSALCAMICLGLVYYGVRVTWHNFQAGAYYATVLELPNAPFLAVIPLGALLLFIQFLRQISGSFKDWKALKNRE